MAMKDTLSSIGELAKRKYANGIVWLTAPFRELDTFFDKNRHLFTIIGVFSALSAYLSNINQGRTALPFYRVALFGGFGVVVIASTVLLHNLWQQATRDDYAALEYRNWGLWLFASVFLPLLAVLSSLLSTFSNYLSFYYIFGGYFLGVAIGLGYLSGMMGLVRYVDEKSEMVASALLVVLSTAPLFLFYFAADSGLVYTDVNTLTGGGDPELWLKFFIGIFLAWTAVFCFLVIAGLLSLGSIIAVLGTILYLLEFILGLPGVRKITPPSLRTRIRGYREKIVEYDDL